MISWHALEGDLSQIVNKPGVPPQKKLVETTCSNLRQFVRDNHGDPAILQMFEQTNMLQRVLPLQALWLVEVCTILKKNIDQTVRHEQRLKYAASISCTEW